MRKKRIRKVIIAAVILILLSAVSISAFMETSVTYRFSSGKADVHLEEYTMKNGERVPWENGATVMPGGYLWKIPIIVNDGAACYIRTSVNFESERPSSQPLTVDSLDGIGEQWIRQGDFFYYKEVLKEEQQVVFFEGIHIPETWEMGTDDGNDWNVDVKVEAVQAENFIPDFSSQDPWHMEEENYEIQKAAEDTPTSEQPEINPVVFEIASEESGFSVEIQDSLKNLGSFMPGDTKSGVVMIKNQTLQERKIKVYADLLEETLLMEQMEITIYWNDGQQDELLYHGTIQKMINEGYQIEKILSGNSEGKMKFEFYLPKETDNTYSVKTGQAKFVFTTDVLKTFSTAEKVKTGDENNSWIWWIALGISLAMGSAYCIERKGRHG